MTIVEDYNYYNSSNKYYNYDKHNNNNHYH